ncbi:MAG: hypothetical protein IID06_04010 [Gemmatimonadetes bacterium]|nr:hypothetical protein [Gemmatimonadota bacterium]
MFRDVRAWRLLEAIAPLGRMRFVVENGRVTGFEVLVQNQVRFSAQRTQ